MSEVRSRSFPSRILVSVGVGLVALGLAACSGLDSLEGPGAAAQEFETTTAPEVEVVTTLGSTTTTEPVQAVSPTADLEQAMRSKADVNGPFGYVTLSPLCTDCEPSGEIVQLYLVPSSDDAEVRVVSQAWVDDVEADSSESIWSLDPVDVPILLLEAMDAGKSVSWTIHPGTYLVQSWTIDGQGATYGCYQVETRSIDLREKTCAGGMLGRG